MGVTVHRPVRALHPHPGPGSGTGTDCVAAAGFARFSLTARDGRRGVALAGSTARDEGRGTRADPRGRRRGRDHTIRKISIPIRNNFMCAVPVVR